MEIINELKSLCDLGGPSGFEDVPAAKAVELMQGICDEAKIDRFGNAVGVLRCGKKNAKKILLDAHLDEIGFIVTDYDGGFLRFGGLGGADQRMLPDREVLLLADKPLFGVITCQPPHVLSPEDMNKSFEMKDLRIDTGLSEEKAKKLIPIGTPVVFRSEGFKIGKRNYCGKSIDDRGCFIALLHALKLLKEAREEGWLAVDVWLMGSKFEEVGGRGALTGTFAVDPDECIAVDVTHGTTPDSGKQCDGLKIGEGPVIALGPNCSRRMSEAMIELAESKGISYQIEVLEGHSGTNGWEMQISREGIPTQVISLALKYMHTPVEYIDTADIDSTAELVAEYILSREA